METSGRVNDCSRELGVDVPVALLAAGSLNGSGDIVLYLRSSDGGPRHLRDAKPLANSGITVGATDERRSTVQLVCRSRLTLTSYQTISKGRWVKRDP